MSQRRVFIGAILSNITFLAFAVSVPETAATPISVHLATSSLLLLLGFWFISEGEWPEGDPHDEVNP